MRPPTRFLLELERARALLAVGAPQAAAARLRHLLAQGVLERRGIGPLLGLRAETLLAQTRLARGDHAAARRLSLRLGRRIEGLLESQDGFVRMGLRQSHKEVHDALARAELGLGRPRRAWSVASSLKARELSRVVGRASDSARDAPEPPDDPNTALVEYHVAAETTHAYVVHGGQVRVLDLGLGEAALGRRVARLLEPLRAVARAGAHYALEDFDLGLAAELHELLLEPVRACLPPRHARLIVVADGPLHALPFELLVAGQRVRHPACLGSLAAFDEPRYAGDELVISYALSSRLVVASGPGRQARAAPRFLGIGYSPSRPALVPTPDGELELGELAGVEEELVAIASLYADAELLRGPAARPASLLRQARQRDIVHIAAHAVADSRAPGLSGILLAGERASGGSTFLGAAQIRASSTRASLVTLSACDTGQGRLVDREGILGLARAFLEAGASAVLASLWPVADVATRELMTAFYRGLGAGLSRAEALARAKRELRARLETSLVPPHAHPFFWASFVLVDHAPGEVHARLSALRGSSRPA